MRGDVVAELFEWLARKRLVHALDLLQTDNVGFALFEPALHRLDTRLYGIDVPRRDAHAPFFPRRGRNEPGHDENIPASYSEKLVPHPQEAVAWGFSIRNEAPINSSE